MTVTEQTLDTRAVERWVSNGDEFICASHDCPSRGNWILFRAQKKDKRVVVNIYRTEDSRRVWDRVEHYHLECYIALDKPHRRNSEGSGERPERTFKVKA